MMDIFGKRLCRLHVHTTQPTAGGSLFSVGIREKHHDLGNPRAGRQF